MKGIHPYAYAHMLRSFSFQKDAEWTVAGIDTAINQGGEVYIAENDELSLLQTLFSRVDGIKHCYS